MTFEQAFKRIKTKFANVDASKLQDMALQITFSDEDCGGTFYAAVRGGVLEVEPYDYRDNDAVIDASRAAISSVLGGKTTAEKEIEKGTITVKGNLEKAAEFKNAIKAPVKKAALGKSSEKKAETKSAAKKSAPKKPVKKAETKSAAKTAPKKTAIKAETKKTEPKKAPAKAEPKKAEPKKAPAKAEESTAVKETAKKTTTRKTADKTVK